MPSEPQINESSDQPSKQVKLVTTNQAAAIIGCSPQQVRTLVRKGTLPSERVPSKRNPTGYDIRVPKSAAQAYSKRVPRRGWPRGVKRK